MTAFALSSVLVKELIEEIGGEGKNPGGLVISSSPTNGPNPAVQSLSSYLDESVVVI